MPERFAIASVIEALSAPTVPVVVTATVQVVPPSDVDGVPFTGAVPVIPADEVRVRFEPVTPVTGSEKTTEKFSGPALAGDVPVFTNEVIVGAAVSYTYTCEAGSEPVAAFVAASLTLVRFASASVIVELF